MKMLIDTTLCIECQACVVACLQENNYSNLVPRIKMRIANPRNCHHCAEPACVIFCPHGALQKINGGAVIWQEPLCSGCKLCLTFCPHGSVNYDIQRGAPVKCLLCPERLAQGMEPACVAVCPTGARLFGKDEEILNLVEQRLHELKQKGQRVYCSPGGKAGDEVIFILLEAGK